MKNIDPQQAQTALETLEGILTEPEYTAYKVHVVINRILSANGEKTIRPQMMYNYARNGLLVKGEKLTGETLRPITREEAAAFILRFVLGKGLEVKFEIAQKEETEVSTTDQAVVETVVQEPEADMAEEFETVS